METTVKIEMTAEQAAEFKAYQQAKERKEAQERARQMRSDYDAMVDKEIEAAIPELRKLSENIKALKQKVYDNFSAILELKAEMFKLSKGKEIEVKSNTFTNSRGDMRITLGAYMVDNYRTLQKMAWPSLRSTSLPLPRMPKARRWWIWY